MLFIPKSIVTYADLSGLPDRSLVLDVRNDSVAATDSTSKQTLYSYTIPANTLKNNNDTLIVTAQLQLSANTNVKTVGLDLGSSNIGAHTTNVSGPIIFVYCVVTRLTETTQNGIIRFFRDISSLNIGSEANLTEDLSTSVNLILYGTPNVAVANEIIAESWRVIYIPGA